MVAAFEGREIRASELGRWFFKTHRREAFASLSKLIGTEVVDREAAGLGLVCPPEYLEETRAAVLAELTRDAAVAYGLGTTPERYVALRFRQGLDDHLLQRVEEERQRWLFGRIIRWQAMHTDRVELEVIVVREEPLAREIAAKLDQGADFARLAQQHSVHESGKDGGRMPPLPREALNPTVAAVAFGLREGARSGVLEIDDGAGHRQLEMIRVVRFHPRRDVAWAEARAEIESGLRARPVDWVEWSAWYLVLERLYKVRLADNL